MDNYTSVNKSSGKQNVEGMENVFGLSQDKAFVNEPPQITSPALMKHSTSTMSTQSKNGEIENKDQTIPEEKIPPPPIMKATLKSMPILDIAKDNISEIQRRDNASGDSLSSSTSTFIFPEEKSVTTKKCGNLLPHTNTMKPLSDFKEKIKNFTGDCLMSLIDGLKGLQSSYEDRELSLNLQETKNKLQTEQSMKLKELYDKIDKLCESTFEYKTQNSDINKTFQKNIPVDAKPIPMNVMVGKTESKENSEDESVTSGIQIEELLEKLDIIETQSEKLKTIKDLVEKLALFQRENCRLRNDLDACKENINILKRQLQHADIIVAHARSQKQDMAHELKGAHSVLNELKAKYKTDYDTNYREHVNEIKQLCSELENMKHDSHDLMNNIGELEQKCLLMNNVEHQMQEAQDYFIEMQTFIQRSQQQLKTQELLQIEFEKLLTSDEKKGREVNSLSLKLSKVHLLMIKMQEDAHRTQQLLKVRSTLINKLLNKENKQNALLDQKDCTINQLMADVNIKVKELQEQSISLSNKENEQLRNYDNIKILEEGNDRYQMIRVKQEEKTGYLQDEITKFKRTLRNHAEKHFLRNF